MSIRIEFHAQGSNNVVRVDGKLSSSAVPHLKKVCDPIEDPFIIDLSNLLFSDDEGISAIRAIVDRGARIHGASPFVQLLLDHPTG